MPNENRTILTPMPALARCRHPAEPAPHGAPIELCAQDFKQAP